MVRLVYYSIACLDHGNSERRWTRSIQSLRKYNSSVTVLLFVYGTPRPETLAVAKRCRVEVLLCGDYSDSFGAVPAHQVAALVRYRVLHKFLSLKRIPSCGIQQVLYLDCDTYFLGDIDRLFAQYAAESFYAREEVLSRRSHHGYDTDYLDEELLGEIARDEGLLGVPPYNTGVCLMNHGVWRELRPLIDDFCGYVWRLLVGACLWRPEAVWDEAFAAYILQNIRNEDRRAALRYPSRNGWIAEEIGWWLTLGRLPHLTHGVFSQSDVAQGGLEYRTSTGFMLAHYFSVNESRFFAHMEEAVTALTPVRDRIACGAIENLSRR
jgi:hypothetical protein